MKCCKFMATVWQPSRAASSRPRLLPIQSRQLQQFRVADPFPSVQKSRRHDTNRTATKRATDRFQHKCDHKTRRETATAPTTDALADQTDRPCATSQPNFQASEPPKNFCSQKLPIITGQQHIIHKHNDAFLHPLNNRRHHVLPSNAQGPTP